MTFWSTVTIIGCVVYVVAAFLNYRASRLVRTLDVLKPNGPAEWPRVSIVSTACNEAGKIEGAVKSKLESDYPDFELILVDDRSTDGTAEIIDRIARSDGRIKALHIDKLPDGWLGKPHALARGVELADGDWYLFSDADVVFSRDVIRKAVALCMERGFDQLGILPNMWMGKFILNILLATFVRLYSLVGAFWGLNIPRVETFTGVGAFNLVRRSAFERTAGFQWLRLDIADDVALGKMVRRSGGKTWVANGTRDLRVEWYASIREMAVGLERGFFATMGNFSLWRTVFFATLFLIIELFPFFGLVLFPVGWLKAVCALMILLALANAVGMSMWFGGPVLPAIFFPIGSLIFAGMMVRAGWAGRRRGGIVWRGTFYPSRVMKGGRRITLP